MKEWDILSICGGERKPGNRESVSGVMF